MHLTKQLNYFPYWQWVQWQINLKLNVKNRVQYLYQPNVISQKNFIYIHIYICFFNHYVFIVMSLKTNFGLTVIVDNTFLKQPIVLLMLGNYKWCPTITWRKHSLYIYCPCDKICNLSMSGKKNWQDKKNFGWEERPKNITNRSIEEVRTYSH